jgi:hypothetical protein
MNAINLNKTLLGLHDAANGSRKPYMASEMKATNLKKPNRASVMQPMNLKKSVDKCRK